MRGRGDYYKMTGYRLAEAINAMLAMRAAKSLPVERRKKGRPRSMSR